MSNEHITDEQILKTLRPDVWAHVEGHHRKQLLADARAILALRPAAKPVGEPDRVPMKEEQIESMFLARVRAPAEGKKDAWYWYAWGVSDGEARHGITTPKADK